ncbi:hypothetical protein JZ751_029388 [Albula glossodonta]|uniref:AF4/FMR2 C-terminal homology domain-containing protein n=1 Tax=Albula glossodonta TaxID=121402 RepID=A0A8T2PAS6_9TELE|nr:hypothetical protein JZ751_029388 [Albula glossodonta]
MCFIDCYVDALSSPGSLSVSPCSLPGPAVRTGEPGHSSGASGSSSESESSSESDSDSESSSSDSECNNASRTATPEPEPPSTNKWQLYKWLNKVNPHNKALINTQPESHGLGSTQPEDSQAMEGQGGGKGKTSAALTQPDAKDRALLSPVREKAKPRMGQKAPEGKSAKVKSPASAEQAPARRSTGKKQPKKVERSSSTEEHSWPKPGNPSTTPKEKEPPPLDPPKPRTKGATGKTAPRKEPRPPSAPAPVQDKKKHRGPNKITPKSKEFIETESSSSECHSDPEELLKVPPPCPGPGGLSLLKSKDCNSNILSVSSLASTSSTSIPDPGVGDLLEDPLFSPIPMVQNELLSPLRDLDEIKSLWVKIELSFLSRVPGQDPPEPPPVKVEPRDPGSKHRRQSPASNPADKPPSNSSSQRTVMPSAGAKSYGWRKTHCFYPPAYPLSTTTRPPAQKTRQRSSQESERIGSSPHYCRRSPTSPSASAGPASAARSARRAAPEEDAHGKPSSSFHGNGQPDPDLWSTPSSTSMDHLEPRRPKLMFNDTLHNADYYMQEAKKLKHKADALQDKFGKAVNYADGALSFIECGNAMERDPLEAKSPYTMYSETVELIRSAGTPSPMSLSPSPVSSVSSSSGPLVSSSSSASSSSGSVAIPQRIHHMAASHVNITNNILRSYEHWDTADKLSRESQAEFFQDLDSVMDPLTQQSSMTELVRYVRQGLHWLRIEAHLL